MPGAQSVQELEQNLGYMRETIPFKLWDDWKAAGLMEPSAPVPVRADV